MSEKSLLRFAIVSEWFFGILGIVLSELMQSSLPALLQQYLENEMEAEVTTFEILLIPFGLPFLLLFFVASICLFFMQRWARWLYLGCTCFGVIAMPFLGPTVTHALPDTFDELSILLSGLILGISFFGTVFSTRPSQQNFQESSDA